MSTNPASSTPLPNTATTAPPPLPALHDQDKVDESQFPDGVGESAIPEDKKEEAAENKEGDWETDPANARNWPSSKKWRMVYIVSAYTFVSPLASSTMAPALPEIAAQFSVTNDTIIGMMLSIFLLSYSIGPLLFAPLSEIYGRTWVLHINNLLFAAVNLGCAWAPNAATLIGLRFLAGFFGSAPIAIGGGSVGDLFSARERASAMALYSLGPLMGPALGPIAGGYIAQTVGFRWIFIVIACCCAVAAVFGIPLLRETYAPVIRARRSKTATNDKEKLKPDSPVLVTRENKWSVLYVNLSRPFILLTRSLICFMLSLYMALLYGIYYLMFSTFGTLFGDEYGFGPGATGLCYLGLGLGFCISTILSAWYGNKIYGTMVDKNGGVGKPEYRVPALIIGSFVVPVGIFWYGWSAQAGIQFVMPIIGTGIFGFGLMATYLPIQLYLVDAFTYAASALGAASVLRSFVGFLFPLFATQMFETLGYGGGNSLLAGLSIILGIPFPLFIYYYGEQLRARGSLTR